MDLLEATPISKKLLIKTGQRWLFLKAPNEFLESFVSINVETKTVITNEIFNVVLLFVKNSTELKSALPAINSVLTPETVLFIAYLKKSSGIKSDLEMTGNWQEPEKYA